MRRSAFLLCFLLTGCFAHDAKPSFPPGSVDWNDLLALDPESAEFTPDGLEMRLTVQIPADVKLPIPSGVTQVTAYAEADVPAIVVMRNDVTGRRRCHSWPDGEWFTTNAPWCSGLTAVDQLPATWQAEVRGEALTAQLILRFDTRPLDGLAASINLEQLSLPTRGVLPTESFVIPSWDSTPLYVEVTRPEGGGPAPVVIASSPYNQGFHDAGVGAMYDTFAHDWASRGYAIAVADVRGTGKSSGCLDLWGAKEQKDHAFLVEWAAQQAWSNGAVAFYGQSYLGTAALQAAVAASASLKAVIAVAPVPDAYHDWHFGGVPNGEQLMSPVNYNVYEGMGTSAAGDIASIEQALARACGAAVLAPATDPLALYSAFYEERNLTARASGVAAPTLYTQGYFDFNVKSSMAPLFLREHAAKKLALLGPWDHRHPSRPDQETLFVAWLDEHLKGRSTGVRELPEAIAVVGEFEVHGQPETQALGLYPDRAFRNLVQVAAEGQAQVTLVAQANAPIDGAAVTLEWSPQEKIAVLSPIKLSLVGSLVGPNAHVIGTLTKIAPDGTRNLITLGMANLAHRSGHDAYVPATPLEEIRMDLEFLPVGLVLDPANSYEVEIRGVDPADWQLASPTPPAAMTLRGGTDGVRVEIQTIAAGHLVPLPRSAGGRP